MALLVCEDCGHKVSDLALACPQCGRPISTLRGSEPVRQSPREFRAAVASPTADSGAQPVLPEAWIGDLKRARDLPAGVKVCKRCNADVSLDSFRKKSDDGYLCADCLDEEEDRRRVRGEFLTRMLVTIGVLLIAGAVTVGTIHVIPMLQSSKGVKTAK